RAWHRAWHLGSYSCSGGRPFGSAVCISQRVHGGETCWRGVLDVSRTQNDSQQDTIEPRSFSSRDDRGRIDKGDFLAGLLHERLESKSRTLLPRVLATVHRFGRRIKSVPLSFSDCCLTLLARSGIC